MVINVGFLVWNLLRADSIVLAHLLQLFLGTRGTGECRIEVRQELPQARGRVLVKLNVEDANLQAVIDLLPALKSPTVSKLFGEDGYAVETVVSKTDINTLIPALKDYGATGILEIPIAKIVQ